MRCALRKIFKTWRQTHEPLLWGFEINADPRKVIDALSEDLLVRFSDLSLLNAYDVYQRFIEYWDEVMQDDLYLISVPAGSRLPNHEGLSRTKKRRSERRRI